MGEFVVDVKADSSEVLEGIDDAVGNGGLGGDTEGKGGGGDVLDGSLESGDKTVGVDGEDGLVQNRAIIVAGLHGHTEAERLETHLLEKGDLGRTDSLASEAHLVVLRDRDHTLVDLGRNLEGVEETDLGGIHASRSGWDDNVDGGGGTKLGGSLDLVGLEFGFKLENRLVGEDKSDLVFDEGNQRLEFGNSSTVFAEVLELFG